MRWRGKALRESAFDYDYDSESWLQSWRASVMHNIGVLPLSSSWSSDSCQTSSASVLALVDRSPATSTPLYTQDYLCNTHLPQLQAEMVDRSQVHSVIIEEHCRAVFEDHIALPRHRNQNFQCF
jgi:hypothetical protein